MKNQRKQKNAQEKSSLISIKLGDQADNRQITPKKPKQSKIQKKNINFLSKKTFNSITMNFLTEQQLQKNRKAFNICCVFATCGKNSVN